VEHRNQLLDELEKLASFMDIPFARRKDYRWIMRNVSINNTDDKKIKKIITICQLLMKEDING
jgi:hypothetical protein